MKTALVQIGDSRCIRIPGSFLEQCQFPGEVELENHGNHLIIRTTSKPRSGWEDAFRRMRENGDDKLLDDASQSVDEWDITEIP